MQIYKRIKFIFKYFLIIILSYSRASDSLNYRKRNFFFGSGISYFKINEEKERKYYDIEYGGFYLTGGYESKYLITDLRFQFAKSKETGYVFGEWNWGFKVDFFKRHKVSLMTGFYLYRSLKKIIVTVDDLPYYYKYTTNYNSSQYLLVRVRDTSFSFYQGSSNFSQLDISSGKFKIIGTNLMYLIVMHLRLEYVLKITDNWGLSISGSSFFSNSLNYLFYVYKKSYTYFSGYNHNHYDGGTQFFSYDNTLRKFILNKCSDPPQVTQTTIPRYLVPNNFLFNVSIGLKYNF